jgi:ribosome-associated protein
MTNNPKDFSGELVFTASRSSGPGGQNVNKVSTKVEVRFHVESSNLLSPEEKEFVLVVLAKKISSEGYLIVVSQSERSQLQNREKAVEKLNALINKAITPAKKRKPTRPSAESKARRLEAKKVQAEKKSSRKAIDID